MATPYRIGTPGTPWGDKERADWLASTEVQRSYTADVLDKLTALHDRFEVREYGALSGPSKAWPRDRYPLFSARTKGWSAAKPSVLVTGGVHGYETSGVQGALQFLRTLPDRFVERFNLLVCPCVSPWGYETIQRWNAFAVDPNRSFADGSSEESKALIELVASMEVERWLVHVDLHETTDADKLEFRPAKFARDGLALDAAGAYFVSAIPDGFYVVGDSLNPQPSFQAAVIDAVKRVTHIAPPDEAGNIIGSPIVQEGVINYPVKELGLCASVAAAAYCTTTEVYPDSPRASDQICNDAQVAAITGALDFLLNEGIT